MTSHVAKFVFPGHPDKLCDVIADALVAEAISREPRALVGVEVAVSSQSRLCHRAHYPWEELRRV